MTGITKVDEDPDIKRSGAKGCLWTVGIVSIAVLLIASSLLSYWVIRENNGRKLVNAKLEELRNRGIPLDNASSLEWYQANTDPTDVRAWEEIFAATSSNEFSEWSQGIEAFDPKAVGTGWTESGWTGEAAERNLLAKTVDLRHRIRELAKKRVPVRFLREIDSVNTLLPQAQQSRTVQRLLGSEFQVAFADRDSKACRESIEAGLDIPYLFRSDPWIVCHMISVAHRGVAMRNILQAIAYDVFSEEDLDAILTRLASEPPTLDRLPLMIRGERATIMEVMQDPNNYQVFDGKGANQSFQAMLGRASSRDLLHLLEFFDAIEALDISDIDQLVTQAREIDKTIRLQISSAGILDSNDWRITSVSLPPFNAMVTALVQDVVQERFTRHALAIRLYQKRQSRFPATLNDVSEIGFDTRQYLPWGGKPFGYCVEEGDAILWATIPQDGSSTSDNPPAIDSQAGDQELRKQFYLRIRPSVK